MGKNKEGMMFQLSDNLRNAIITTAMEESSHVHKANMEALQRQQEERRKREDEKCNEELGKLAEEYVESTMYHKMYKSTTFWKSAAEVDQGLKLISSNTQKLKAVQDNIRICVKGFGLQIYYINWTNNGKKTPFTTLVGHLKRII